MRKTNWRKFAACFLLACGMLRGVGAETFVPPGEELSPEVKIFPERTSRAQWLWFDVPKLQPDSDCFYRYSFDLKAPAALGQCYWSADDSGQLYVNGQLAPQVKFDRPTVGIGCNKYEIGRAHV